MTRSLFYSGNEKLPKRRFACRSLQNLVDNVQSHLSYSIQPKSVGWLALLTDWVSMPAGLVAGPTVKDAELHFLPSGGCNRYSYFLPTGRWPGLHGVVEYQDV